MGKKQISCDRVNVGRLGYGVRRVEFVGVGGGGERPKGGRGGGWNIADSRVKVDGVNGGGRGGQGDGGGVGRRVGKSGK